MKPKLIHFSEGTKIWSLKNGKCHREDGPAIEFTNGYAVWYLNGIQLTEEELLNEEIKINYPKLYNNYLVYQIMGS